MVREGCGQVYSSSSISAGPPCVGAVPQLKLNASLEEGSPTLFSHSRFQQPVPLDTHPSLLRNGNRSAETPTGLAISFVTSGHPVHIFANNFISPP